MRGIVHGTFFAPRFSLHAGFAPAGEALTRHMAGELAAFHIRSVCIRSHAIPEAAAAGSHSHEVFRPAAERMGMTVEQMLAAKPAGLLVKRLPSLDQVANTAVFVASGHAGAMTGAVVNLSGGVTLDCPSGRAVVHDHRADDPVARLLSEIFQIER